MEKGTASRRSSSTHSGNPVSIIADDREARGGMIDILRGMPEFSVGVERLSVGDYRVDNRFLFERKTLPDLVASIASGRLFQQALRLAGVESWRTAMILEGTARDIEGSGMCREAIQGALVTVSLFIGLPLLRTRCARETARVMLFAARQGRTVASGGLPRQGKRPTGKRALQSYLLQGLPGIGPARAARLLAHFGSVEAVLMAGRDEIEAVAGIGRHIAALMRWAVEESAPPYRSVDDCACGRVTEWDDLLTFFQSSPWARTDIDLIRG
ncbi:ERCC4 domain-containing protein [Thiohalophilus sp.]|uniref:ERCC4 domain-containing protein n=1 Tax=Thiohalophilus sp. TaxID=3028392 RepID=UPI002ACEAD85|nr:ERCC4 domain-containing protein [Thiohalophilus sp.]MDZ7663635.1 ERCC4 domain-containing protein [Thiohalophilus sp.]